MSSPKDVVENDTLFIFKKATFLPNQKVIKANGAKYISPRVIKKKIFISFLCLRNSGNSCNTRTAHKTTLADGIG